MVRLFALRRAAIAVVLSTATVIAVASGFVGGPVEAGATTAPAGSISATGPLPVPSTGTGVTAGSITITLSAAGSLPTGTTLALDVTASGGTVHWNAYQVTVSSGISYTSTMHIGSNLYIGLGAKDATQTAKIFITGVKFTTSSAEGEVEASPILNGVTFTPSSVTDGMVVQTPPGAPAIALAARSQTQLDLGESDGAAGTWTLTMSGDVTAGSGWVAGSVLTITVSPPSGTNCAGGGYLYYAGTPSVEVVAASGTSATPSVSAALEGTGGCSTSQPDRLTLTFANAVYFDTTAETTVRLQISEIRYAVGTSANATGSGTVGVSASFSATGSIVTTTDAPNASISVATQVGSGAPTSPPTSTSTSSSSSTPASLALEAGTPPVTVPEDSHDAAIGPVHVIESSTTHVPVGYVCLTLSGAQFDTAATGSVSVSRGSGTAAVAVTYQGASATAAPTVEFQVTKSSTSAGEYTVSGLAVDAGTRTGPVTLIGTYGTSASCAADPAPIGSATAFTVIGTVVTRIYGTTPDATAAAELEHQFDAESTGCPGRAGARPVVLATDAGYADALTSAYLASALGTGELLTPTRSLSAAALDAIKLEGITQVYVVGGPLAVSTAVSDQLESTLAYVCGGTTPLTSDGPVHVEVVRIAGATEYDTAEWVAEYPNADNVGSLDVAGAYAGTNRTGGTGRYNDTAGSSSAAPGSSSTLPTAIVATGRTFQDAESASVLSYADRLPILLTTASKLSPQVSSALESLGIGQVVVMGGPLAVSNGVVTSLESLGVSVLRVAGHDATDTAVQLADFEMGSQSGDLGAGWSGDGALTVARGDYFTDGLAGAIVAAGAGRTHTHLPEPLLLCESPTAVGPYLSAFLSAAGRTGIDGDASDRVSALTVLGGPEAVSPSVVTTMTGNL